MLSACRQSNPSKAPGWREVGSDFGAYVLEKLMHICVCDLVNRDVGARMSQEQDEHLFCPSLTSLVSSALPSIPWIKTVYFCVINPSLYILGYIFKK